MKIKAIKLFILCSMMAACTNNGTNNQEVCEKQTSQCEKEVYSKKYTNADFYKDGIFQTEVALNAMKDMFKFYNIPVTEFMEKEMWVTDFGLGDFEHLGMGGIFWVNNPEYRYFGHSIYLLPGQMIPEHAHVATKNFPAKHETWMVQNGWVYSFTEIGEKTYDAPEIPASHGPVKSKNFIVQTPGEFQSLKEIECYHFMMAGPEGAIVNEWANYHDNAGLRFTNTKAVM